MSSTGNNTGNRAAFGSSSGAFQMRETVPGMIATWPRIIFTVIIFMRGFPSLYNIILATTI